MEGAAQRMGQSVAGSQTRVVKGDAGHGRRAVNLLPCIKTSCKGAGQLVQRRLKGKKGQGVGKQSGFFRCHGLQTVGQHVHSCVGDEPGGQLGQQRRLQDRHGRTQALLHQGIFDPVVGQHSKGGNLRAGAGGGGDGHQPRFRLTQGEDALGTVDGAAAAESQNGIRHELVQHGDPGGNLRHIRVGTHAGENTAFSAAEGGDPCRRTVLLKERIGDYQNPSEGGIFQRLQGIFTENQLRGHGKCLHFIASFLPIVSANSEKM